jgi:hypothetical protein
MAREQRIALIISAIWIPGVVAAATLSHRLYILSLLGVLGGVLSLLALRMDRRRKREDQEKL